jgi:hypothetical protein
MPVKVKNAGVPKLSDRQVRLTVSLTDEEYDAIQEYANTQTRDMEYQAGMLLREILVQKGLLVLPEYKTGRD